MKGNWGEGKMTHFSTQEWIDYVNQTVSTTDRQAMQQHLTTGCKPCLKAVSLWQKVRAAASAEADYQPPQGAARLAKATFLTTNSGKHPRASRGVVELLFDSFLQPALAGTRSAAAGSRQMLYRADPYQIDIHVENKAGTNRLAIAGQILDISNPRLTAQGVQVVLSNCRGNTVLLSTNDFGEFVGELENSGDLELSISNSDDRPVVISLRDTLGKFSGGNA